MNYLRGALGAAAQYYRDINPATLTGAIDVIVVRRTGESGDEELACSPFHVRFGKWQVLRPGDRKVKVLVNGNEIPFHMKIGEAGEAFFVIETDEDVPDELLTSPILEATKSDAEDVGVTPGRFGAKQSSSGDSGNDDGSDPNAREKPLSEIEPLDLDAQDAAGASDSQSQSRPPWYQQMPSDSQSYSPSRLLQRAGSLGKAVVQAAVEKEREERENIEDKIAAARNVATRAFTRSGEDSGDNALPRVNSDEGQPPKVEYRDGIVLDNEGYAGPSKGRRRRTMKRGSRETIREESDDYDSYEGPSTPRSGDISQDVTPTRTPDTSRSPSPDTSDKEAYKKFRATSEPPEFTQDDTAPAYSWEWGGFPMPSPLKSSFSPNRPSTHDALRSVSVPPHHEVDSSVRPTTPTRARTTTDVYPSPPSTPTTSGRASPVFGEGADLTADENHGRRFLVTIGNRTYEFGLSICEFDGTDEFEDAKRFKEGQVSFRRFMKFPAVLEDEHLVIRWNDNYITRKDGSVLFGCLGKWRETALAKPRNAQALEEEEPLSSSDEFESETTRVTPKKTSSWVRWWRSSRTEPQKPAAPSTPVPGQQRGRDGDIKNVQSSPQRPGILPSTSAPVNAGKNSTIAFPSMMSLPDAVTRDDGRSRSPSPSARGKHFAKTMRLSTEQLRQLNLKPGMNSMTFSLSASGDAVCTASIFLWDENDTVVVSDIDGTITKSDALGHVFTMIGRDWTHIGVAKLYTDICRNGYKIMYLTSRAIGQADSTRYYLKGIKQNNYQLPEGPVIMSPDRLMASFHREVIARKPEVFKMAALRDIQSLFGKSKKPFYAGFGNRITDALSYRTVNIPSRKIFTIDSSGVVKLELLEVTGHTTTYVDLTEFVDQYFPPMHQKHESEFTDFNYWKAPVQDFALPDLSPPSPALSATSETSTLSRLRHFSLRGNGAQLPLLPSPVTQGEGVSGNAILRSMTSLERLSRRHTRSESSLRASMEEDEGKAEADEEAAWELRARKRLSVDSMPGSLSGSQADFEDFDEEEDEVAGFGGEGGERDDQFDGDSEDPEEAAEEGFDDDLLATGEMESVPFL